MTDYPTAVTTRLKTAVNNLTFSLSAIVAIADVTVFVTSTTGAPTASSFHIANEVIYYTGKAADRFTGCTRGQDGTVAIAHDTVAGGNEVVFGPEAHHVNDLNEEMIGIQTALGITGAFNFVDVTQVQTIAGVKTFSSSPIVPTPTTDYQAATKKYGDDTFSPIVNLLTANTITSHATPTPIRSSNRNIFTITAQAEAAAFAAPSGTPAEGDTLLIRIKDDGSAWGLTYNAIYRAMGTALPSTTVISKTLYIMLIFNNTDTKWDCVATRQET